MTRLARAEVFDPSEVAILHLCARLVRRCFLLGVEPVTGINHDHRKVWIEEQFKLLAEISESISLRSQFSRIIFTQSLSQDRTLFKPGMTPNGLGAG